MKVSRYALFKLYVKSKKLFNNLKVEYIIDYLQKTAWVLLSILILIVLWNILFGKAEQIIPLVASIGIILSALLASYSMILNINKNIETLNREHSNRVRNIFFQLCLVKMRLISLLVEKEREKVTYLDIHRFYESIDDIIVSLKGIDTQELVTIMHNNILQDMHFVYLELLSVQTAIKAMKKTLIESKHNSEIFPNPLKINFRLEIAIERLSSTLTYLKNGYVKDFPGKGGLEDCAEYNNNEDITKLTRTS